MTNPTNPYGGKPPEKWPGITQTLLANHPLQPEVIREAALVAWAQVWQTTVGSGPIAVSLAALRVPATVVGYFFEVLLAREIHRRYPEVWRGNKSGEEKDLVCLKDPRFSVEVKTSGQLGDRVYGNRSYGQETRNPDLVKKEKSGYYITANFYSQTITLLRFGWIDASDWRPQASPTGQMAGLSDAVYRGKLIEIPGDYRLDAPVELLDGVGDKLAAKFQSLNVRTIRQLLDYPGQLAETRLRTIRDQARARFAPAIGSSPEQSST